MPIKSTSWPTLPLFLLAVAVAVSVSAGGIGTGLVMLAAAAMAVGQRRRAALPAPAVLAALGALFGSYFLATLLSSPYPHNWAKCGEELWIKSLLVAVPVLVGARLRLAERALLTALVIGVVAAAYAVVQHFLGSDPLTGRSIYRPQFGTSAVSGFFSHHLSYAGQAMIFLLLGAAWWLDRPTWRRGLLILPALAVLTAALLWTFSRSALLGAGAGGLVLIACYRGRARWLGVAGALAAATALVVAAPVGSHFLQILQMDRHLTRLNLWQSSWQGIKAHPLLGFGPGNFRLLLAEHQVPGHYETLGHSHNDLLMHGVNAGVPGMLAALALLVTTCLVFRAGWRRRQPGGWVLLGAFAVQVGITVAGLFQVYQTDDEVEILLYFVLGCALAVAGRSGGREPAAQSRG